MASQQQIIEWFESLVPDINESEPRSVLTKFAEEKNLAPAQLEKLGHVYNTAKTLSFMDNNKERYASFGVLDVPEMIKNYEQPQTEKLLTQESEKSASNNTVMIHNHLPNLFYYSDEEKSASSELEHKIDDYFMQLHEKQNYYKNYEHLNLNKQAAEQYAFDLEQKVINNLNELVKFARENPEDYQQQLQSVYEDSYLETQDESLKKFASELQNYFTNKTTVNVQLHDNFEKKALTDTKNKRLKNKFNETFDQFNLYKAANLVIADFEEQLDNLSKKDDSSQDNNKKNTVSEIFAKEAKDDKKDDKKNDDKDKKNDNNKKPNAVDKILNVKDKGKKILPDGGKNKKELDEITLKERQQIVADMLFNNDPVLANLDEEEHGIAVSAFNTIRNVAPNVTTDPGTIRPIIRSAVEYGGVTPNEVATIMDLEERMQKIMLNKDRINENKYSA